jgi:WD40 repeat protein
MILVAGDDETVRIWELSTKNCLQVLEDHGKRWGQITCLAWLGGHSDTDLNPIAFGTARSLIVIYRRPRVGVSLNGYHWVLSYNIT